VKLPYREKIHKRFLEDFEGQKGVGGGNPPVMAERWSPALLPAKTGRLQAWVFLIRFDLA